MRCFKIFITSASLLWGLLNGSLLSQIIPYENLNFIYLDNSKIDLEGEGDVNQAMFKEIENQIGKGGENIMFYLSNGQTPSFGKGSREVEGIMAQVWTSEVLFALDKKTELFQLEKTVFSEPFTVQKEISIHFFVTKTFIKRLNSGIPWIVSHFPSELKSLVGNRGNTLNISIYYPKDVDFSPPKMDDSFYLKSFDESKINYVFKQL